MCADLFFCECACLCMCVCVWFGLYARVCVRVRACVDCVFGRVGLLALLSV